MTDKIKDMEDLQTRIRDHVRKDTGFSDKFLKEVFEERLKQVMDPDYEPPKDRSDEPEMI